MKVCVFGGTNPATNPKWYGVAEEVGKLLVENNIELVWGGNSHGVLAKIYKEYVEKQGKQTLFLPEVYKDDLKSMETLDSKEVVMTQTVCQRAEAMLAAADVVVVMPGGIGTIFEFWTAIEVRRAEEYKFDIILLDYDNFYKHQLAHYDFINDQGFTKIGVGGAPYRIDPKDLFKVAKTPKEVIDLLKQTKKK